MKNYTGEPVTFIEIENGIIIDTIIIESDGLLDKETDPIPEGNDYVLVTRKYRDLKRSDKDCWKLLIPISPYFEKRWQA